MNAQIRELAEQAGFSQLDIRNGFDYNEDNPCLKFAELIIQKCITQIALVGVSNFENDDIMWTVETSIAGIENYFGIEYENANSSSKDRKDG